MTKVSDWRVEFLLLLRKGNISVETPSLLGSSDVVVYSVKRDDWKLISETAALFHCRFVALWAKQVNDAIQLFLCLELSGRYLILSTMLSFDQLEIASWSAIYPAANRIERHVFDMFGVVFTDHVDFKRWIRHQAWRDTQFPLRKDFNVKQVGGMETPPDSEYPFLRVEGCGVCEVPVGPVHAGIIEPGHFRFQIAGEDVLNLEERLGYVHKGIEKIAEGRDVHALVRLAGRVSGDSTVSYAWAACRACENAVNFQVPERASYLRAIMAERERIANHLGDVGAICNDVGFAFAHYQFSRLRELWLRLNDEIFHHRLMMDCVIFGGVKKDISDHHIEKMHKQIAKVKQELKELLPILDNTHSLQDRIKTTGVLKSATAKKLGVLGYVGRASGQPEDLRKCAPYFPYDTLDLHVPISHVGDVSARMHIRFEEIKTSLNLLTTLLNKLPMTDIQAEYRGSFNNVEGVGLIEGWRGELFTYVSFDQSGTVDRYYPRDPSWFHWPALEHLILGNIVPDFPVCNKSVNGSYSGHDL